jgi:hypothetical protein
LLINLLCLVGQSTQLHVLDHTGAQRCHRLLLRRRHTGGTTPPRHRRIASPASLRPCRHSLGRSRSVQPEALRAIRFNRVAILRSRNRRRSPPGGRWADLPGAGRAFVHAASAQPVGPPAKSPRSCPQTAPFRAPPAPISTM